MAADLDFHNEGDKTALLGLCNSGMLETCRVHLASLGYKVRAAADREDFFLKFGRVPYQVVLIDDAFSPSSGITVLEVLQTMPMAQRRHAGVFLLSDRFVTLHPMQALRQSVQAVLNPVDLSKLDQIVSQAMADSEILFRPFREAQARQAQMKA